jgi:hypothetical protein
MIKYEEKQLDAALIHFKEDQKQKVALRKKEERNVIDLVKNK